jgi:UDP-N-acetylmuramoyl-tripeptide--D-alanyl-D-alanine ligase
MIVPFRRRGSIGEAGKGEMPLFTVEEVLEVTSGRLLSGDDRRLRDNIRRLCTDSREVGRGDLFVALKGERHDGHDFVESSLRQGAIGALVETEYRLSASVTTGSSAAPRRQGLRTTPLLLGVPDSLVAYQQLASYHRSRFDMPVVAVTGSNGKTTTKEMVARVLAERWGVLKTEGNFNNRIGVPQTLLRLTSRHKAAVIEMGVDQKGQTTRLTEIVRPTIGLITNIGPDHLEFFGTLEDSAQAKGELLDLLRPEDAVVLNADDVFFDYLASRARCRILSFGLCSKAQVRATEIVPDRRHGTAFRLTLPGRTRPVPVGLAAHGVHNVSNALAAAAVGHLCELSGSRIAHGLSRFRPPTMRSQVETWEGIQVINDCYNANPASMKAAIDVLVNLGADARTIAVVGDMLELGPDSPTLHREVGAYLAGQGVSLLIACGRLGRDLAEGARTAGMVDDRVHEAADAREASSLLLSVVRRHDVVLVKASRGMRLEHVIEALRNRSSARAAADKRLTSSGKGHKR